MAKFTFRLARKTNPKKQIGSVTVLGKSLKAAKSAAGKLLGAMNRGLASARTANRRPRPAIKRKTNRRKRNTLNFGQRMKRLRARKANKRRRR